jgi:hypothetical protein
VSSARRREIEHEGGRTKRNELEASVSVGAFSRSRGFLDSGSFLKAGVTCNLQTAKPTSSCNAEGRLIIRALHYTRLSVKGRIGSRAIESGERVGRALANKSIE